MLSGVHHLLTVEAPVRSACCDHPKEDHHIKPDEIFGSYPFCRMCPGYVVEVGGRDRYGPDWGGKAWHEWRPAVPLPFGA